MINELDKNRNLKLKKKLKITRMESYFTNKKNLKEVYAKRLRKKTLWEREIKKIFGKKNNDDLFKKNLDISKTKHKKTRFT
ncbi:MAG: hypothetical protein CM15mV38_0050 [uncultured marine virus]|nr:MAG: hypothetical protein CM15mV38_0050 [uncultured marine virus]